MPTFRCADDVVIPSAPIMTVRCRRHLTDLLDGHERLRTASLARRHPEGHQVVRPKTGGRRAARVPLRICGSCAHSLNCGVLPQVHGDDHGGAAAGRDHLRHHHQRLRPGCADRPRRVRSNSYIYIDVQRCSQINFVNNPPAPWGHRYRPDSAVKRDRAHSGRARRAAKHRRALEAAGAFGE